MKPVKLNVRANLDLSSSERTQSAKLQCLPGLFVGAETAKTGP